MLGYWTVPSFQAQNQVSKKKKQLCELEPRCFLFMCPKTEKNCTGSAKSCINVRCWINCYYQTPPKEFDWPATSPETDRNKKTLGTSCEHHVSNYRTSPVQFSGSWLERGLPSFTSDGSSINALQSKWNEGNGGGRLDSLWHLGKVFHFSTRNRNKRVAFVLCRKSYTHLCRFSNNFLI